MAEIKAPMRLAGAMASQFINSKLTPLFIAASLLLGTFAILKTPREEEPQIVVPMLDVFVEMPGATPAEVEQRASIPMERLLREVDGVEYVYSISRPGMSMLVVRFYVGTKEEDAIVKTYNKLYSNFDRIPAGVSQPLIKVRSINDVPIMALTLWGKNYDAYQLRQIAGELENQLKQLNNVSETKIIGGLPRQVRVTLDTQKLAAYGMTPGAVVAQRKGRMRAAIPAVLPAIIRSLRWRRAGFSGRPAICSKLSSGYTTDARCICATWRRRLPTARRSRTITFCTRTVRVARVRCGATIRQ